ncbi:hypothetical protein L1887_60786 [Cichorium endivia]|nr:hypothetical protein L1887_60786 [Cichorium endivia]
MARASDQHDSRRGVGFFDVHDVRALHSARMDDAGQCGMNSSSAHTGRERERLQSERGCRASEAAEGESTLRLSTALAQCGCASHAHVGCSPWHFELELSLGGAGYRRGLCSTPFASLP